MIINTAFVPTPLAKVASRLNIVGPSQSADTFLIASYLAEAAIKMMGIALYSGFLHTSKNHAYGIAFDACRADGLGEWERIIQVNSSQPAASFLPPEFHPFLAWLTKKRNNEDERPFLDARLAADEVLLRLGVERRQESRNSTVRNLISSLVEIRNKTKAHGAVGPDFFEAVNQMYISSISFLVLSCPVFSWNWMHLSVREKGNIRGVSLRSESPKYMKDSDSSKYSVVGPGIYFAAEQPVRTFRAADLIRTSLECAQFLVPNGGFTDKGFGECIDYASGQTSRQDFSTFLNPPAPLPPSETQGLNQFDVQSNVFGNLPEIPAGYVRRDKIESELRERLLDRNHPIITLHGRGGIGKTSVALYGAHELSTSEIPPFEHIVWFSARDVDLKPSGPISVSPAVIDLNQVSIMYGRLFGVPGDLKSFSEVLQSPTKHSGAGILFIFDNFESMEGVAELHRFLDTHTHLPNKVLITSRERAFKADFPIEVRGMEFQEAAQLMRALAIDLRIEGIVTDEVIKTIYDYTEGHAYVMRIIIGEIAKEQRYAPPTQVIPRRIDIVNAVFERSFNKLSYAGKHTFLSIANWKSVIPELALIVVLGQRGFDVEGGIDECLRLSLISRQELADGQPCYSAPQLARVFGRKKLDGDPDRFVIQEDLETIRRFGAVGRSTYDSQEDIIRRFITWCTSEVIREPKLFNRLDGIFETLAELWPRAWVELAAFREQHQGDQIKIGYALRRAVEELPFDKSAWLKRADFAAKAHDEAVGIASLISAVEADPGDVNLIREVAFQLCRYVNDHSYEIPRARRGVYLATVRSHMESVSNRLDATGLSRLAWLFLLEGKEDRAIRFAELGIMKDPNNQHCLRILERIDNPSQH
ncbi:MAG: hypothetical protein WBD19_12360 [Candidatus Acidiferrum sp.]